MNGLYSKKYLLLALKRAGVPYSYKALLRYEALGVVPPPNNAIGFGTGTAKWRLYTQEEIDSIVAKVVAYKRKIK